MLAAQEVDVLGEVQVQLQLPNSPCSLLSDWVQQVAQVVGPLPDASRSARSAARRSCGTPAARTSDRNTPKVPI